VHIWCSHFRIRRSSSGNPIHVQFSMFIRSIRN
jgi:hypothetical protein